jgi:DNA-binding NtrC family response regulator/pSer/pThr/pTyr-binding forkhead associated (FHA) protein
LSSQTKLTAADTRPDYFQSRERAVLVVYVEGNDAGTRVVEIPDGAQLTIGRARTASIFIDSERVSRIHARINRRGSEIFVEDAGSRNGTWVNGEAVTGSRVIASGDEIVVGPATLLANITTRAQPAGARVETSRRLEQELAMQVDRGMRFHRVFSLLMVRIDGDAADVDAAVDRISSKLRTMDLLAEYAPNEYAIVLPELDAQTVDPNASEIIQAARTHEGMPANVTVIGGLAAFPAHGTAGGALIARARAAVASVQNRKAPVAAPPEDPNPTGDMIVGDPQMLRVYELVRKVADHPITVLVNGETGVGKEVIAAAIHQASSRRAGPLVRLNCASVPETLLESTLFGYEKGAFTGADRRTAGYFEAAHGGTLFLDEIGEVSAGMQAKLLRVLEERCLTRVGGTQEIAVDVRVVCATNRDLESEVRRGAFRSDLFFRISAFTILVPPLRDRPMEILLLAEHFIAQCAGRNRPVLSPSAASALKAYAWPGNVRELRNAIERAVVVRSGRVIELDDLPDQIRDLVADGPIVRDVRDRFADLERTAIERALAAAEGNQTEAAKALGISRRALIYRMEKYGLKPLPASRS